MIYFFDNYEVLSSINAAEVIPADRLAKYNRLRQPRDKENCLGAYLLLSYALRENGISRFELDYSENGKPFLKNNSSLFFNISHCKSGIAVAVSKSPVGIDIQEISHYNSMVAKRVFSSEEQNYVTESDNPDIEFTRIWTLKECALKYDGKSLINLGDYTFKKPKERFTENGCNFSTYTVKNLIISVCGKEDFSYTNKLNFVEDLL